MMSLSGAERQWYYDQIVKLDSKRKVVTLDEATKVLIYNEIIQSDEALRRDATDEELVRALTLCILASKDYKYPPDNFYIEKYYEHGSTSPLGRGRDEVDLIIYDDENLPFAMWEFKSAEEYERYFENAIRFQLFGTSPLVGAPKILVYATIKPAGITPVMTLTCIDRTRYPSFESWIDDARPNTSIFPPAYTILSFEPLTKGGRLDLRLDCTPADFKAVAETLHTEFFSEHPDTDLFTNLVKCLLAKIYDEQQRRTGEEYDFQIFYRKGKEESALEVFERVNRNYQSAYRRYIDPVAKPDDLDEINPKEFAAERVKTVVRLLQGMSITQGAALHGDVVGAFFEAILRSGFKQDKGMYFTHANLVYFMLEAIDLAGLTVETWKKATYPGNRLPYVIDPSCGSGSFLLRAMQIITSTIRNQKEDLVTDLESEKYFSTRMSDMIPNSWADTFIYGMDPKFVMAITARVNMVLHGDGSSHIFKQDALKSLPTFADTKLSPISDPYRTVTKDRYLFDVCESFDVIVSNPPFGITLSSDTRVALSRTYSISGSAPSECIFLERWFQLLKPDGRMGVVVPESLLNTVENAESRLFLYRTFWIRAIVSLPRNLFIDTPTLTSLLFAQKKTAKEIAEWDEAWASMMSECESKKLSAQVFLRETRKQIKRGASINLPDIQKAFTEKLSPLVTGQTSIMKKGGGPLTVTLPSNMVLPDAACKYYLEILNIAGFAQLMRNYVFSSLCGMFDYEFPVYMVDEVGFKLSKRRERLRPNQLCRFVSPEGTEIPNLSLAKEPVELVVNSTEPERILDYIRRDVKWR
jgi:type I restriction enzyme M protein